MEEDILNILILILYVFCCLQFVLSLWKKSKFKYEYLFGVIIFPIIHFADQFLIREILSTYIRIFPSLNFFGDFNIYAQFFLFFVFFDFLVYWIHRLYHSSPFFWCNHIIHHSGKKYSPHLKIRESFMTFLPTLIIPILFLLGFDEKVIILNLLLSFIVDTFNHINIRFKFKYIEYIFVTPRIHRLHHLQKTAKDVRNFGNILLVWDHIFGTFELAKDESAFEEIGVASFVSTNNPFLDCINPFASYFKDKIGMK